MKVLVEQCPNLYKIKLEHNQIDSLDKLKCLAGHKITKINIEGNPLTNDNKEYRKELFELIPSLQSIDGVDKKGEPVESTYYGEEEDEEGLGGNEKDDDDNEELDEEEDDENNEEDDDEENEKKPNKKPKN